MINLPFLIYYFLNKRRVFIALSFPGKSGQINVAVVSFLAGFTKCVMKWDLLLRIGLTQTSMLNTE